MDDKNERMMTPPGHRRRISPSHLSPIGVALDTACILLAALLLTIALGWGAAQAWPQATSALRALGIAADGPTYSVADLQRQVARDPGDWIGRTVLVQGRAALDRTWTAPDSIVTRIELIDPDASGGTPGLSLAWGSADPLRTLLRRLPLIGRLALRPQGLHWGVVATYRVQLQAIPASSRGIGVCFEALLLHAPPPDALGEYSDGAPL